MRRTSANRYVRRGPSRVTPGAPVSTRGAGANGWRQNAGGQKRTIKEAVEIARKNGVKISDDIEFREADLNKRNTDPNETVDASYNPDIRSEKEIVTWEKFLDDDGNVRVNIDSSVLTSDEAIVDVMAHEMHEIDQVRSVLDADEPQRMTGKEFKETKDGWLHEQAWDVGNEKVGQMRANERAAAPAATGGSTSQKPEGQ